MLLGLLTGSLSELGLTDCGKAGFGQISCSFSLNSSGYMTIGAIQGKSLRHNLLWFPARD
jgi:hypothetical protein